MSSRRRRARPGHRLLTIPASTRRCATTKPSSRRPINTQVTPWWQIQPDIQYVFNPGAGIVNPERPDGQKIGNEAGVRPAHEHHCFEGGNRATNYRAISYQAGCASTAVGALRRLVLRAAARRRAPTALLESLHHHATLASTIPDNGDLNPYAVVVAPATSGKIQKGDVLVDNFNNISNLQGTGGTIVDYNPATTTTHAVRQTAAEPAAMSRRRRPHHGDDHAAAAAG